MWSTFGKDVDCENRSWDAAEDADAHIQFRLPFQQSGSVMCANETCGSADINPSPCPENAIAECCPLW